MRCFLDLQLLASGLGQALVISHFLHQIGHSRPKKRFQFGAFNLGIFDAIVKQGGHEQGFVVHAVDLGQDVGHFQKVVDVGFFGFTFTSLGRVTLGGEVGGMKELTHAPQFVA